MRISGNRVEHVSCICCGSYDRLLPAVADALGGRWYCDDCQDEIPEGHPQHPDVEFEI